jgi:hypothetical protein
MFLPFPPPSPPPAAAAAALNRRYLPDRSYEDWKLEELEFYDDDL